MKQVYSSERIPVKSWATDLESEAIQQAKNLANLPFAFHHVALMPDAHMGYGMPIGGVLATEGMVIPNAVGVDIGCGMCAVKLPIKELPDTDTLKYIMNMIRKDIPLGFKKHSTRAHSGKMPYVSVKDSTYPVVNREYCNAAKSLGTLGGGNHFIEIQKGSDGHIYVMVHSGSRNLGKQVCDHYNKIAQALNERWKTQVPKSWGLAFLPIDSIEGHDYLREMKYCTDFALANRKEMMSKIVGAFYTLLDIKEDHDEMINKCHNEARMENHFGKNVMVHRKGATSARDGELGIIPGSQGTSSFIVRGKGNPDSFTSCSHGAGRVMGRRQAKEKLSLEDEINKLDSQGIVHSIRTVSDLDEATGAYKDILTVMENQKDLVDIEVRLQPLAVIKG
jgi:tRNA-splicing ligase RtcB